MAALPDELLEDIFLRLPPDEPACLVRASLASKPWLDLLTGPRYRDFHGAPPMLGFIYNGPRYEKQDDLPRFVATSKFGVRGSGVEDWGLYRKGQGYAAWDCRHGRVLFGNSDIIWPMLPLVIWDPMTGRRRLLELPPDAEPYELSMAAVFCNVTGCDHRACHDGPFQVVFAGLSNNYDEEANEGAFAAAHISLPEVGEWSSKPCSLDFPIGEDQFFFDGPPVFSQGAFYFMLSYTYDDDDADDIVGLKYDLSSNCLSLIHVPPAVDAEKAGETIFMAMEDGSLGYAYVDCELMLNLCSRHMGSSGVMSWTPLRVVNLATLLPIRNHEETVNVIGSAEGRDIIFLATDHGTYEVNLKSLRVKKTWNTARYSALFPYMSFYHPPERVDALLTTHG